MVWPKAGHGPDDVYWGKVLFLRDPGLSLTKQRNVLPQLLWEDVYNLRNSLEVPGRERKDWSGLRIWPLAS